MAKDNGSSLVKYGSFSVDDANEDAREKEESKQSKFVKLAEGKTVLRWIPPLPGKKWRRVYYMHYVDIPGVGNVSFVCPRLEAKKPCPVCEEARKLEATGREKDQKRARRLAPKRRCLASVIVRGREADGPKLFEFGSMIEDQLIEIRKDEDLGGDFVDPVGGVDIAIVRKGKGTDTEYKVVAANKGRTLPLSDDAHQMNDWIKTQINLESHVKVLSVDEIQAKLRGEEEGGGRRSRDEDEDERPTRSSRRNLDDEMDDEEEIEI